MNTMKVAFVIALATGMALQVGAMPRTGQVADLIEGQMATAEYDAELAGDYVDPTPVPAGAEPWGDMNNLRNLALQADLVFHGVVIDISYRLSEPSGPEQTRVPFTFITYWVERVVLGQPAGEYVTLRFIGGYDEQSAGFLATSITPEIEVGDEDILFVTGNNQSICPLVGNFQGRLRVVDNKVYSESGREVTLNQGDLMNLGPRHLLPEVLEQRVYTAGGVLTLETNFSSGLVQAESHAMAPEDLLNHVESFGLQPAAGAAFVNADLNAYLPGPEITEAPETEDFEKAPVLDPEMKTDQEFDELEELAVPVEAGR